MKTKKPTLSLEQREAEAFKRFQELVAVLQAELEVDTVVRHNPDTLALCQKLGFNPLPPQLVFEGKPK